MSQSELIGFIGVGLLLIAFVLSQTKKITTSHKGYNALNFIGAALACYSSWLIQFIPFVILEGIWALVSLIALLSKPQQ